MAASTRAINRDENEEERRPEDDPGETGEGERRTEEDEGRERQEDPPRDPETRTTNQVQQPHTKEGARTGGATQMRAEEAEVLALRARLAALTLTARLPEHHPLNPVQRERADYQVLPRLIQPAGRLGELQ